VMKADDRNARLEQRKTGTQKDIGAELGVFCNN
jgi:hypothetical protein